MIHENLQKLQWISIERLLKYLTIILIEVIKLSVSFNNSINNFTIKITKQSLFIVNDNFLKFKKWNESISKI